MNYSYLQGKRPPSYKTLDPFAELRIQSLPKHAITAAGRLDTAADGLRPDHRSPRLCDVEQDTGHRPRCAQTPIAVDIESNVANGRISLQNIPIGPSQLKIALFGKNLLGTAYPVFTAPGSNAILSPPRTYGIELGASF